MYAEMKRYMVERGGAWSWGRCDCIGLLMHLCEVTTERTFHRSDYIDTRLGYVQATLWIAGLTDPMRPFRDLMERDAEFADSFDTHRWDVSIIQTKAPLTLSDRRTIYPTHQTPGVIFHPEGMEPCIMHRTGFAPITWSWGDISRSLHYQLFGVG